MDIRERKHCKYNINYHLVWCPKYRHNVLTGDVESFLRGLILITCKNYGYDLLNLEVMPDHIHLFVSAPPYVAPMDIVKTIKSISAVKVFKTFKKLKQEKFWGSGLWSKGYYVGTAGTVTAETIQKYIEEQKKYTGVSSPPTRGEVFTPVFFIKRTEATSIVESAYYGNSVRKLTLFSRRPK